MTAEQELDRFLSALDEQNDYFDGEQGLRLNAAKQELIHMRQKSTNILAMARLNEMIAIIDQRYEALDPIYK